MLYLKKNWGIISVLIGYLVAIIISWATMSSLTFDNAAQKRKVIEQTMPLSEQIKMFIPRTEIDAKFNLMFKQLDRIENKLDK
jgi:hypothetical protein